MNRVWTTRVKALGAPLVRYLRGDGDPRGAPARSLRRGWQILVFGFGAFLFWATFAPIDQGLTATGWVVTDGQRKSVQHLTGGIVDDIFVREGEIVRAGQLLVRMNDVNAQSQKNVTEAGIAALSSQLEGLNIAIERKRAQLQLIRGQLSNMRTLATEGVIPKNRVIEIDRTRIAEEAALAEDEGNLARLKKQINGETERLNPQVFELTNTEVRAPVAGEVINLAVFTRGGVIAPGAKIMDIVPDGSPLVVEGQLPVHLIDKATPGLPVELMFTAFNQNRTPHIPAVLTMVGGDRLVDERSGMPYFRVYAQVTDEGRAMIGALKVRSGMPVEIFIRTGERSLMSYLLKPVLDRLHSSLREE